MPIESVERWQQIVEAVENAMEDGPSNQAALFPHDPDEDAPIVTETRL
jgi:hypothetical protein